MLCGLPVLSASAYYDTYIFAAPPMSPGSRLMGRFLGRLSWLNLVSAVGLVQPGCPKAARRQRHAAGDLRRDGRGPGLLQVRRQAPAPRGGVAVCGHRWRRRHPGVPVGRLAPGPGHGPRPGNRDRLSGARARRQAPGRGLAVRDPRHDRERLADDGRVPGHTHPQRDPPRWLQLSALVQYVVLSDGRWQLRLRPLWLDHQPDPQQVLSDELPIRESQPCPPSKSLSAPRPSSGRFPFIARLSTRYLPLLLCSPAHLDV